MRFITTLVPTVIVIVGYFIVTGKLSVFKRKNLI